MPRSGGVAFSPTMVTGEALFPLPVEALLPSLVIYSIKFKWIKVGTVIAERGGNGMERQ